MGKDRVHVRGNAVTKGDSTLKQHWLDGGNCGYPQVITSWKYVVEQVRNKN